MKVLKVLLVLSVLVAGIAAAYSVYQHAGWKQVRLGLEFRFAVDKADNVYIADGSNNTIDKVAPDGTLTILASGPRDPSAALRIRREPQLFGTGGIALGPDGSIITFDEHTIYRRTLDGRASVLAGAPWTETFSDFKETLDTGKPSPKGYADGLGAEARFNNVSGIAVDKAGNIYAADYSNDCIRKITPDGRVTTLAGKSGEKGHEDGLGAAARFFSPMGVVVDGAGNVFVADGGNDTIRKVNPEGMVTTLAGKAGQFGNADGAGDDARFNRLEYIAIDGAGNLYVIDSINRNLRKITPEGVVSTPEVFFGGEVAFDGAGNMYQRDYHSIQKISPSGLSSYLVRPPKYPVGHLETIMSYLPEGGAGFAVIAVALVNVMLLVMGIAFAANWVVQVVWKAALKTRPPAIFYSLAALAVSLLIAALGIFALPEFRNVYQQFGANWPTVTLIAVYLTERYLPLLLVIVMLVLLVVLRNKPRRERYFAVIFAGETALLFMIVGSLFWPLYKVGETMR